MSKPRILRPRRNRLTPFGTIEATPHRGTVLANRGDLHDEDGRVVHLWRRTRWITCTLAPAGGGRVAFDKPGRYTPLFALDEATTFAAGHRPCAECRPDAYARFVAAWRKVKSLPDDAFLRARDIDEELHRERIQRGRQVAHAARLRDLPDGVFVALPEAPMLWWEGELRAWSQAGYGPPRNTSTDAWAAVLTPAPTVAVPRAGYRPNVWLALVSTAQPASPPSRLAQGMLDLTDGGARREGAREAVQRSR